MSFVEFYRRKRDRDPFPWMCRLAERFAADDLPDVINLPTGCAKTEIILIWAWARRRNAGLARRLWIASDRRVITDQAFEVAKVLEDEVQVSRLRGGIVLDDEPILDPVKPQVISSTIDQLGSRLLYRAYGASPRSWPIWAGLAGNDSLIVLDEAHLSPTAEDTFRACRALGAGIRIIAMTATPRASDLEVFGLEAEDYADPCLRRRLEARRIVELRQGASLAGAAQELLDDGCVRVAVVCNTVRQARDVFTALKHMDKHFLTGRQRPLDRDRIMGGLMARVGSGSGPSAPLVVVATQCIEAGADLDFDGMVSEICPVDALRQRLGRLNRLGKAGDSRCILIAPDPLEDRVAPYGPAPRATWQWLSRHATRRRIDLGARGWAELAEFVPDEARSSRPEKISFLEPHLRMLARTSPRPRVEPEVDLLLHGSGRASGDVSVAWRRDVEVEDTERDSEILRLVPPTGLEACPVPLWEFRNWLEGRLLATDSGDIEGAALSPTATAPVTLPAERRRVLRWIGQDDGAEAVAASQLRPGDVVVLPAHWGGYDAFGWAPASIEPVPDIADEAFLQRTGRLLQRLSDPDAEVAGDRVRRWSGGVVVETFTDRRRSRAVPCEVPLDRHALAVAERARTYAAELGLDEEVLYRAGLYHDAGKAHWEWQLRVNGGKLQRLAEPPLAKGEHRHDPLSRLPRAWRHEAESLARLPPDAGDLVSWLVATHHGHARPFWPIAMHGVGQAELMDRLQAELGYWRLALHETVLRCADRAVSREEEL